MLLTNMQIKVKWNGNNKKHYIDLGYKFTKLHDEFYVNPIHLPESNKSIVYCECDDCHEIFTMRYDQYINRKQKETFCLNCRNEHRNHYMILKQVKMGKMSFYDWCIDNNRLDLLNAWNGELNKIDPREVYYNSQKSYWFNCLKNSSHEPEKFRLNNLIDPSQKGASCCRQCNSFEQWCIYNYNIDYLDLWDYDLNNMKPTDISYGSNKSCYFKCPKGIHDSELKMINKITVSKRHVYDCKKCNSFAQYLIDIFGNDALEQYWSYDKNNMNPWNISRASSTYKVWLKCIYGHEPFEVLPNKVVWHGVQCPECMRDINASLLHKKVIKYLEDKYPNLTVTYESCASVIPRNPENNHVMPYDICIEDLSCVCEVQGLQHYTQTNWCNRKAEKNGTTPEEEFQRRQWKDAYKKQYALDHGYEYLEIPYWTEKDESYKTLIDNKIAEILSSAPSTIKMKPRYRSA